MSWAEPAVPQGYHDVGQPAHDGGSILQEPSRVLLHQRPRVERSFMLEGLAVEAASIGSRCCSCKSAISVDEVRWSGPLELPPCRTAPLHCPVPPRRLLSTVCRCLQTAPLHCLLVGHDSSTSNPDRSASFCRGVGLGS